IIAAFSPTPLNKDTTTLLSGVADRVAIALDQHGSGRQTFLQDRAIAASVNGIVISDPNQRDNPIIYASSGFERMTGYASTEIIGQNCRFLQRADRDQEGVRELRTAIAEERGCRVNLRNYRKDGSLFYNELTLSPVTDETGVFINFIGIQSDITARGLIEQERDELLQRVESALAIRNQFIA
ncbi:MAG: PAS domain-containing protein, partial [Chloroflexota bacterium]|nr:PAS domain-containing protein [Chloroflexota bacterium]